MSRKGLIGYLAVVLIVVAAAGVGVFYLTGDRASEEIAQEPTQAIEIKEINTTFSFSIKSCSSVDKEFKCEAAAIFNPGDRIYFLINARNALAGQLEDFAYYELQVEKQLKNLDDGNVLMSFEESSEVVINEANASPGELVNIPLSTELITLPEDKAGNYEYAVRIKDIISGEKYENSARIVLE